MWEQHVEWGCMRGPDMCPFKKQLMSITCQKQFQPFGGISVEKTDSGQGRCGAYMLVGVLNVVMGLSQ